MKKHAYAVLSIAILFLITSVVHSQNSKSKEKYTSLAIELSRERAYALQENDKDIDVIDTKTGTVTNTILRHKEIETIAVDEQRKILIAAGDRKLHIVSTDTLEILKSILIEEEPTSVTIDSDPGRALVTHEEGRISVIDLTTYKILTLISVSKKPVSSAVDPGLRLAVIAHNTGGEENDSDDKDRRDRDNVTIIDLNTFAIVNTLRAGKKPSHVTINRVTHQAVVTNEKSNDLTIIDLTTGAVTGTVPVQKHPRASSFNVCLSTLSVIGGEGTYYLSVIDGSTWTQKASYPFDEKLSALEINSSQNKAVIAGKAGLTVFNLPNPVPVLSSITPDKAIRGATSLAITAAGQGIFATTEIYFNNVKADTVFLSCGSMKVNVPDAYLLQAGKIEIKAVNPTPEGGASNILYFSVDNPVPSIASLQPTQIQAGSVDLSLTVIGAGFALDTIIYVNNVPRIYTFISQTTLQLLLTTADLESGGYLDITALNPQPGGGLSTAARFIVVNPVPALSSLTPATIQVNSADTTLVLIGDNFVKSSQVYYNNQPVATRFVNKTRVEATIPAVVLINSRTFPIKVNNPSPGGGESSVITVTVTQAGNPNVAPLPDGSFGKQYEGLVPADATIAAYTPKRFRHRDRTGKRQESARDT